MSVAQEVPVPLGLKATYIPTDSVNYIHLLWNKKNNKDQVTIGYNVLIDFPPEDRLVMLGKAGLVFNNEYYFEVKNSTSAKYRFAVLGVNNFPEIKRSKMSEIIEIITPSTSLPNIKIEEVKVRGEQIVLQWNYQHNIADLKGFRVYVNNELLIDEDEIDAKTHRLFFAYKEKGKYAFQLTAVTETGIESRFSQKRILNIE